MPSKRFWIIAGAVALGAGATAVAAQGVRHVDDRGGYYGGHGEYRHEGRWRSWWRGPITKQRYDARSRARFAQIDENGDGVVDAEEARQVIARRMARRGGRRMHRAERFARRMIRRFDSDRDGKVTKAEFEGRISTIFARFDLDRDGQITDADLPPMLRGRGFLSGKSDFHRGRRGRGRRFLRILRGADGDGDGQISLAEAQAAAAKRFARWDRNQDGAVDEADVTRFKAEIVDYRARRFLHRFGASGDGKLTRDQFLKARNDRFARLDYDGDGELSRDELPRRWRKWKRWHRSHGRHDYDHYGRDERRHRGGDERRL